MRINTQNFPPLSWQLQPSQMSSDGFLQGVLESGRGLQEFCLHAADLSPDSHRVCASAAVRSLFEHTHNSLPILDTLGTYTVLTCGLTFFLDPGSVSCFSQRRGLGQKRGRLLPLDSGGKSHLCPSPIFKKLNKKRIAARVFLTTSDNLG